MGLREVFPLVRRPVSPRGPGRQGLPRRQRGQAAVPAPHGHPPRLPSPGGGQTPRMGQPVVALMMHVRATQPILVGVVALPFCLSMRDIHG